MYVCASENYCYLLCHFLLWMTLTCRQNKKSVTTAYWTAYVHTSRMSSQLITSDNDAFFLTGPISFLCRISSGSYNQMSTDLPLFYLIPMVLACFCSCQYKGNVFDFNSAYQKWVPLCPCEDTMVSWAVSKFRDRECRRVFSPM